MSKASYLARLRDGLSRRRCPLVVAARILRETAEHFDDLRAATGTDDDARARLGDPEELAARHVEAQRHASWWGRHPLVGFGLLPVLVGPLVWLLLLGTFLAGEYFLVLQLVCHGDGNALFPAISDPAVFPWAWLAVRSADWVAIALLAAFFCSRAKRVALNWPWPLLTSGLLSLFTLCFTTIFQPHSLSIIGVVRPGHLGQLNWGESVVPLMAAAIYWLRVRRETAPPMPALTVDRRL